jgi:hypothetical protein
MNSQSLAMVGGPETTTKEDFRTHIPRTNRESKGGGFYLRLRLCKLAAVAKLKVR